MTLADFTSPGLMVPRLPGRDPASVIFELSQALRRENRVPDLLSFYQAALARESMMGTEMEEGVAFPHARVSGVRELAFALGRADESLVWGRKPAGSTRLVFLIAAPATGSAGYLSLISCLARLGRDPRLAERICAARDAAGMVEALRLVETRGGSPLGPGRPAVA
jgi:mannitol/fructose-specific phosphotransferase system IIA component (Ntr-type)